MVKPSTMMRSHARDWSFILARPVLYTVTTMRAFITNKSQPVTIVTDGPAWPPRAKLHLIPKSGALPPRTTSWKPSRPPLNKSNAPSAS